MQYAIYINNRYFDTVSADSLEEAIERTREDVSDLEEDDDVEAQLVTKEDYLLSIADREIDLLF